MGWAAGGPPERHGARRTRRRLVGLAAGAAGLVALAPLAWFATVRAAPFPVARLAPRTAQSLTVLDREGGVLRQQATAAGGRETWVPLAGISEHLIHATLAAEDHRFHAHAGVDPVGVLRAAWLNVRAGRFVFGGSTLTMQLVRLLEARRGRAGLLDKAREAVGAARLERALGKAAILEQYLNRAYYGHGAYGAEAAARLYLGKPAAALSAGEAAFLAVLPRGPRLYDPYRHEARALARRRHILLRMEALGWLAPGDRALAEQTPLGLRRERPAFRAPHFVDHVLAGLPPAAREGAIVETTLDGPLQRRMEVAVAEHLASVGGRRITQAGLVVLRNADGAVLAMVGSADWFDARRHGAVNVTTTRRRPGSTLKPFVYALAFERGDTAATVAHDVVLPHESREPYTADVRQHGPARYREALAGSYNLAAIHTLDRVGVWALVDRLRLAGLTTLDRPPPGYGLPLAIGDAEVTLLELAAAYAAFGNQGRATRPRAVLRVRHPGSPAAPRPAVPVEDEAGPRLFSPEVAHLVFDILSDPEARRPMFGAQAPVLPFAVALKTGTTRAYTDNLALGTTAEYTVGAWAGNFDGTPTEGMMAMQGAAPLVRAAFTAIAARFGEPTAPPRPAALAEADVCPLSGLRPGPACPTRKRELFVPGTEPPISAPCAWHRRRCGRLEIDHPEESRAWARATGKAVRAPCPEATSAPAPALARAPASDRLRIVYPTDGARFALDPYRPPEQQVPPVRALPGGLAPRWTVGGTPLARWRPTPGEHTIRAEHGSDASEVKIRID